MNLLQAPRQSNCPQRDASSARNETFRREISYFHEFTYSVISDPGSDAPAEQLLNNRLQMGAFSATGKIATQAKQTKIGLCEQVRVN